MEWETYIGKKRFIVKPLDKKLKKLHPMIDIVDDTAYLGYFMDAMFCDEDGEPLHIGTVLIVVNEHGEKILYSDEYLKAQGFRMEMIPVEVDNWWSGEVLNDPPTPKELYEDIYSKFKYYIDADDATIKLLTIWTIGTVFHDIFETYPLLYIRGVKRSGKTTVLTLIKCMGYLGERVQDITEASLFRMIEATKCTLLLDEMDYLADPQKRPLLRTLLLGAYKKGQYVYRSEKKSSDKIKPERYRLYAPVAIANIEGLEDVLADRAIPVTMLRSTRPDILRRRIDEKDEAWLKIRDKLATVFLKNHRDVKKFYENMDLALSEEPILDGLPEHIRDIVMMANQIVYGRNRELWLPIFSLAAWLESHGVDVLRDIVEYAYKTIYERSTDEYETPESILVEVLAMLYEGDGWYSISTIREKYMEVTGLRNVKPQTIGWMMKRIGFMTKIKKSGAIHYYISASNIRNIAERLGINIAALNIQLTNEAKKEAEPKIPLAIMTEKGRKALDKLYIELINKELTSEEIIEMLKKEGISEDDAKAIIEMMLITGKLIKTPNGKYKTT